MKALQEVSAKYDLIKISIIRHSFEECLLKEGVIKTFFYIRQDLLIATTICFLT